MYLFVCSLTHLLIETHAMTKNAICSRTFKNSCPDGFGILLRGLKRNSYVLCPEKILTKGVVEYIPNQVLYASNFTFGSFNLLSMGVLSVHWNSSNFYQILLKNQPALSNIFFTLVQLFFLPEQN